MQGFDVGLFDDAVFDGDDNSYIGLQRMRRLETQAPATGTRQEIVRGEIQAPATGVRIDE